MEKQKPAYSDDLREALNVLKKGGIILYPTDTIWGIGCDARNSEAVKRIFKLKQRADSKSMLVLVNNEAALERIVGEVPEVAWQLLEVTDKPLTIIYEDAHGVAPELIADDGSLGVRIPKEDFSNELCKRLNAPLVSTSANISGQLPPKNFGEISPVIINGVDYVVGYRRDESQGNTASNIIKLGKGGTFKIIR